MIEFDKQLFLLIYNYFKKYKKGFKMLTTISKPFFIIVYILLLLYAFYIGGYNTIFRFIAPPFITIVLCKFLRFAIGRQRPYLIFDNIDLPIKKDASCPSNHTASSFIISFMFLSINMYVACFFIFIAFLVSFSRIVIGVHFPFDVIFGFLIALIIYIHL